MSSPVGRWLLDHREPDGSEVFLPETSFTGRPRRAPRPGIAFSPDGTFAWLRGGPADGHVAQPGGRWRTLDENRVELLPVSGSVKTVTFTGGDSPTLRLT